MKKKHSPLTEIVKASPPPPRPTGNEAWRHDGSRRPAPISTAPRVTADVLCMADVEPVEVPWLWPGRIPLGRITLLVGRPGAGKSFLTCDIAARLSHSLAWPDGGSAPPGDTLFIAAEDDPADTIVPRLIGAGADRQRVHLLRAAKLVEESGKETAVAFDLSNVDLIRETLSGRPDCRLVVVDPIGSYLGGGVDAHRDNEVRGVLAPLAALAAERSVAVLLVCHTRKAVASYADDAALGSRAFTGIARSVLHLSADDADRDRKLLLPGKCNLGKPADGLAYRIVGEPPRLEWESAPLEGMHADDVLTADSGGARHGPKPIARSMAVDWLADLLRDGPVSKMEVEQQVKDAGLSMATVRRARESLGIVPYKETFSGRWLWKLPGEVAQVSPRSCSSSKQPEQLRENAGEKAQKHPTKREVAQVSDNLSNFGERPEQLRNRSPRQAPARDPFDDQMLPD